MIFRKFGLQKEKCPECGGDVYVDPYKDDESPPLVTSYKITCNKCNKEFAESEWPPQ